MGWETYRDLANRRAPSCGSPPLSIAGLGARSKVCGVTAASCARYRSNLLASDPPLAI
jgi:hypothetical protein